MKFIVIKKIAASKNALIPSANKEDYLYGEINLLSLPVEYEIEGYLISDIQVGKPVFVERTKRNGVISSGLFTTSIVVSSLEGFFETLNSVYKIDFDESKNK